MVMLAAETRESPAEAARYEQPELKKLVAICRELQRISGTSPFFLSCRTAGQLLGVNHSTANRWLYLLAKGGVIVETSKGERSTRRASQYRYLGPL